MLFLKLELIGYKRLLLSNIRSITVTPTKMFQLILGTNGCGKSSLLEEFSPLPATPSQYLETGLKRITIDSNRSQYVLTSKIGKSTKHSFLKDEVELNPGGTISIQRELVKQEFGITQGIHDLLIGKVLFTDLSPIKRREWFTKLSNVDYTYAIEVYNRYSKLARDTQGAIKHVNNRLLAEKDKLTTVANVDDLEAKHETLINEVSLILTERVPVDTESIVLESQMRAKLKEIKEKADSFISIVPDTTLGIDSFDSLIENINAVKTEVQVKRELNSALLSEQSELDSILEDFKTLGVEDIDSITEKYNESVSELEALKTKVKRWKGFQGNAVKARRTLYEIKDPLIEILSTLPDNREREYSSNTLERCNQSIRLLNRECGLLTGKNNVDIARLNHLESLGQQNCPKCKHTWSPGRSETEIESLKNAIYKREQELESAQKEIESLSELANNCNEYKNLISNLNRLSTNSAVLKEFWDSVIRTDTLYGNPSSLIPSIYTLEKELELLVPIQALEERIKQLSVILESEDTRNNFKGLTDRRETLDQKCEHYLEEIEVLTQRLKSLNTLKSNLVTLDKRYVSLLDTVNEFKALSLKCTDAIRAESLRKALRSSQSELAIHQHQLSDKKALVSIIEDLEIDYKKLKLELEVLVQITRVLSPTEGIVARQLKSFISHFLGDVNNVISDIWCYGLEVEQKGDLLEDLDYKFPIKTTFDGVENIVEDVSLGSEAQVDIINFAFKIIAMSYLGLDEYPIYLDEFSSSFDEVHREKAIYFIKTLLENNNYSQLFMVNHFASQFGAFTDVETLVLNSSNIALPSIYNTHVTMD